MSSSAALLESSTTRPGRTRPDSSSVAVRTSDGSRPSKRAVRIANSARLSASGPATCSGPEMSRIAASCVTASATSSTCAGQRTSSVKNAASVRSLIASATSCCNADNVTVP